MTKRIRRIAPRPGRDDGQALVEFALVLPLILLLLFGMIDFGKIYNYWNDETHLAATGARFAVVGNNPGDPSLTLQQYIRSQANTGELKNGGTGSVKDAMSVCISFPEDPAANARARGKPLKVETKVTYTLLPWLGKALNPITSMTITGSATMRIETDLTGSTVVNPANNLGSC